LFQDPTKMAVMSPAKLQKLADLVRKEKSSGVITPDETWQEATDNQYLELAKKNEAHFAPSNASLVAPSTESVGQENHKTLWEKYHKEALTLSQGGKKDDALRFNAFADHYLTDAFAAGHVINKLDVIAKFKSGLKKDAEGDFIGDAATFFDTVAKRSFVGVVKTTFSPYEGAKESWKGTGWHPNIDSATAFSVLLQEIQKKEPNLLASVVAKAVHNSLNKLPDGLEVENNKGEKWQLSGDTTLNAKSLNAKSLEVGRKAVARSLLNVLEVFKRIGQLDFAALFRSVWDFVPHPTSSGGKVVTEKVEAGTNPKSESLIAALVALVKSKYQLILDELVRGGYLRKA